MPMCGLGRPNGVERIELDFAALRRANTEAADRERAFFERVKTESLFDIDLIDRRRNERGKPEFGRSEVHRLRQMTDIENQRSIRLRVISILPKIAHKATGWQHDHVRVDEIR